MGEATSTATGTTAPFATMSGISSVTTPEPSLRERPPKSRLRPSCTVSWPPSGGVWAAACPGGETGRPVPATTPRTPSVSSIVRRVMLWSLVISCVSLAGVASGLGCLLVGFLLVGPLDSLPVLNQQLAHRLHQLATQFHHRPVGAPVRGVEHHRVHQPERRPL